VTFYPATKMYRENTISSGAFAPPDGTTASAAGFCSGTVAFFASFWPWPPAPAVGPVVVEVEVDELELS
jgi:hypothetical protein